MGDPLARSGLGQVVVDLLIANGPLSRAALAARTGWAPSTVSRLANTLIADGVVVDSDIVLTGHRGRPFRALRINPSAGCGIGIDFGFRHVRAVIADASQEIRGSAIRELGLDYSPADGLRAAQDLVGELLQTASLRPATLRAVGLALPAPMRGQLVTRSAMIPTWVGQTPGIELERILGVPVRTDNDSKLAASAEAFWGAGRQFDSFLYFLLHSGVGGAVVLNRLVVSGSSGSAGEFGHVCLDPAGPVCRCGGRGCLEVYAAIPAILSALRPAHGPLPTLRQAVDFLTNGDAATHRVFHEAGARVGQAAGSLCNALNPQAIVVGGALAPFAEHLIPEITRGIRLFSLPTNHDVAVVQSQLGRQASAMGAVRLAFTNLPRLAANS